MLPLIGTWPVVKTAMAGSAWLASRRTIIGGNYDPRRSGSANTSCVMLRSSTSSIFTLICSSRNSSIAQPSALKMTQLFQPKFQMLRFSAYSTGGSAISQNPVEEELTGGSLQANVTIPTWLSRRQT